MRKLLYAALLMMIPAAFTAQAQHGYWHRTDGWPGNASPRGLKPERFLSYTIAESAIMQQLAAAPADYEHAVTVDLPAPDGSFRAFRIWNTPVMAEGLAKDFPQITTYTGEAVGATHITAKLDYSPAGFHALVFDGSATYFIEPYDYTASGAYLVFYKKIRARQL